MTNLPKQTWEITAEVRKAGAQGVFEKVTRRVRAEERLVNEWAIDDLHDEGFEVRAILTKERLA